MRKFIDVPFALQFRLTPELLYKLDRYAKKHKMTRSSAIREAVDCIQQ